MKEIKRIACYLISLIMLCSMVVFAEQTEVEPEESVVAYINFGSVVESYNMTASMAEKEDIKVGIELGKEGWILDPTKNKENAFIDFKVDDSVAKNILDGSSYRVEVEFFDESNGSLVLSYDAAEYISPIDYESENPVTTKYRPKEIEYIECSDTNMWKTDGWFMENPYMGGRMANGADFRIGIYGYVMGYSYTSVLISSVKLIKTNTKSISDITLSTKKTGNNFFDEDKENIEFTATIDNRHNLYEAERYGSYDADIIYTVYDSQGNIFQTVTHSVVVNNNRVATDKVKFNVEKYDLYTVKAELENKAKGIYSVEKSCFAFIKDASAHPNQMMGTNFSGAVTDNPKGEDLVELVHKAGFAHIRAPYQYYSEARNYAYDKIEIPEFTWYRQSANDVIKKAREYGLTTMFFGGFSGQNGFKIEDTGESNPITEKGRNRYLNYLREVIKMHGSAMIDYEIWNEWNGHDFYATSEEASGKDYSAMMEYVYKNLKEEYPDLIISGPCPSNVKKTSDGYGWLDMALAGGAAEFCDVLTVHTYEWTGTPLNDSLNIQMENTVELMEKYNCEDLPVYITEVGWMSGWKGTTEEEQGSYDVQSFIMLYQYPQLERIYQFCLYDGIFERARMDKTSYKNFGLIEGGGDAESNPVDDGEVPYSAKPVYLAMSNMNSLFYDAKYKDQIKISDKTRAYIFDKTENNTQLVALFSDMENDKVTLDLGTNEIICYDLYGNKTVRKSTNNKFTFTVSDMVTYVEGNLGRCVVSENSAVSTSSSIINADFGDNCEVKVFNNTGKTLEAEITLLDDSNIICPEKLTIPNGGATLGFKIGSTAVKNNEPIHITVKDDETIYYEGDILVSLVSGVELSCSTNVTDGKYYIDVAITNNTSQAQSGTLSVLKPKQLADITGEKQITVAANSVQNIPIEVPAAMAEADVEAQIRFVNDDPEKLPIYIDETFSFGYAQYAYDKPTIDGNLSDWSKVRIHLTDENNFEVVGEGVFSYFGLSDLSAEAALMWDEEYLYIGMEVTDDVLYAEKATPSTAWMVDSVQMGFVLYPDRVSDREFEELTMSYLDGQPVVYRNVHTFGDNRNTFENHELAIKREGNITCYEIKIPWVELIPNFGGIQEGMYINVGMGINDNDGKGRKGYMMYGNGGSGICEGKNNQKFKKIYIAK